MRADRLVAILLMLQAKGHVTASDVAVELEISERTARRDLDALGMAGVPVYSQQGRGGGWRLAGGGRTDLSGLTSAEARALFLVAGPASATPEVRAALRKLARALPEGFRDHAAAAAAATVVDARSWGARVRQPTTPLHLDALQQAVIEGEQVELGYVARDRATTTRIVHPLGLAAKGPTWYLVADTETGLRTFRVDRVTSVSPTGENVVRSADFDLKTAWALITDRVEQLRAPATAILAAAPQAIGILRMLLGSRLSVGPSDETGRVTAEVRGYSARSLAGEIAGLGKLIEVSEPTEVRTELALIARDLQAIYGHELAEDAQAINASVRSHNTDAAT